MLSDQSEVLARVQRGFSVHFLFFSSKSFPDSLLSLFAKQNFSVLDFGQRGIKWVNAQNLKLLIWYHEFLIKLFSKLKSNGNNGLLAADFIISFRKFINPFGSTSFNCFNKLLYNFLLFDGHASKI